MEQFDRMLEVNGRRYAWPVRPLVVVCIDGSEPAYIEMAVAAGAMPYTRTMLAHGADLRADCVIPSFTNPNNLSIVTGCPPSVHGICGNYFYDRDSGTEVMMNDPALLRAATIFSVFEQVGAKIVIGTAKDKLRGLLGHGLRHGQGGSICFSAERADTATLADNGVAGLIELTGLPRPSVYSAELSEFVFAVGLRLMERDRPDLMYLSTTDYIQHKAAPGSETANAFYRMMDHYWAGLDACGATLVLTADHGMSAKHDNTGAPNVIYLQDELDRMSGAGMARVILPITDPYVVHHGVLGSFATIYLEANASAAVLMDKLAEYEGIEIVLDRAEACRRFELPQDRLGDIVVIATKAMTFGTRASEHDLSGLDAPLRSHGGLAEQTVPLICNVPVQASGRICRWRNFDAFDLGLNFADGPVPAGW